MKIQCSCGATYEFDVTPDMAGRPVQFSCPSCQGDLSESLTQLFQQELTRTAIPVAQPAQSAASAPRMRLQTATHAQTAPVSEPAVEQTASEVEEQRCPRHPAELATNKCFICSKPICPRCMEVFGYVCSPLCKAKANSHGINVPVYEGQRDVAEARLWHRTLAMAGIAAGVIVAAIGVWIWYVYFGSTPKVAFSIRYPEPVLSGQSVLVGKDQLVFLRGDTARRYDMTQKKEVWSRQLVDKEKVKQRVEKIIKDAQKYIDKANSEGWDNVPKMPSREKLMKEEELMEEEALELHIKDQSVWIASSEKLLHLDWDSGKTLQELKIPERYGGVISVGDELLLMQPMDGKQVATHINLTNCDWRTEEIAKLGPPTLIASGKGSDAGSGAGQGTGTAGLPIGMPGKDMDKPMDPKKVAEQAQRLSYPARLALPAILSNARSQERLLKEMQDGNGPKSSSGPKRDPDEDLSVIPTKSGGFLQVAVKTVEHKVVEREAMKPPPPKPVASGNITAGNSDELANEILNEMQRERGGGIIIENKSRYRVTLRAPDGEDSWVGEVSNAFPKIFPLQTVNVLAAGKLIQVFDQKNKKLWESRLNFELSGDIESMDQDRSPYGIHPCAERKGTLYVIDEGVLTAFDIATGDVRWRYPSIGIIGIFFDADGMMYVNTTSAGPDTLKYPHQINISRKDVNIVLKLDPKDGKVLWKAEPGGLVNYVSGKYLYTVQMYMPDEDEEESPYGSGAGPSRMAPYVRIKRINPRNGHVMWEHFQQRAPVDIQFDQNSIRMVFKKEVQILKFWSL